MKKRRLLLLSFALLFILPVIGSFVKWKGFPPGYGLFPAQEVMKDPGFNATYFAVGCVFGASILLFLFFPNLFGFKKPAAVQTTEKPKAGYPSWFVPSLVVTCVSWFFMWGRFSIVQPIDHFTFVPLWWGFILVLDGIVYKRNGGVSLVSSRPTTVKLMAVTSAFSWFVFEFLNFFVLENWYYPNNQILTNFGNISWQLLSYTTVLPAIFEWYWLLRSFKKIKEKYSLGPKINLSRPVLYLFLLVGLSLSFFMSIYPNELFWALWVGLIPVLVPAMTLSKFWNPFTPVGSRGDWSPVVLIAIATLLNGFLWEFWNFGSEWFHDDRPTNPNYWRYSVPYLDKYHIFSEMPVLGYFGYMFFGIGCWLLWGTIAHLFGFSPAVHDEDKTDEPLLKEATGKTIVVEKPSPLKETHEA